MASKKPTAKKVIKDVKKAAKKNPKGLAAFIAVVIVAAILVGVGYFIYKKLNPTQYFVLNGEATTSIKLDSEYRELGAVAKYGDEDVSDKIEISYYKNNNNGEMVNEISTSELSTFVAKYHIEYQKMNRDLYRTINVVEVDPISINFLELGNANTGDSTYIKVGDVDILIDAGSKRNSADTVVNYLKDKIVDDKIEYLIVTHAHEDHIAALVGSNKDNNGVLDNFKVDNIIQFSKTDVTSSLYEDYCAKRDKQIQDNNTNLYLAGDLVSNHTNVIEIGNDVTMTILDQKYYREKASTENNYSVCTLFTQGSNNYLFTGDLEKSGEESLVSLNTLPHCQLFKGGHHGSKTSNNDCLLNAITPEVVCICCCAGNDEYSKEDLNQFPCQDAINRIAKHTDKIYVTTVTDGNDGFKAMNGIITFNSIDGTSYTVHGSNNDIILKETDWFKKHRTWPSNGV